jgi:trigger factor
MDKVFHDNGDGTLNVSVTYTLEDYRPIVDKVVDHLLEGVAVRGFRKGKAPKELAMPYVKNEDIYNGMIDKLIDRDFPTLLKGYDGGKEIANIKPSLNINNDDKKKSYNFLYTFVFLPTAELTKTKGYKIPEEKKTVSDEDVKKEIERLQTDQADLVPSKEAAAMGDHVTMDFTGYIDGKEFDGGSASDYELTLGSHAFVPGFEEALVGLKEGDRKTLDITFPANYIASLANKPAKFSVTVKGVKKVVLPAQDDDFASSLSEYKAKNMEELKAAVKAKLQEKADSDSRAQKIDKIFAALEKDAKILISDKYLELAANSVQENQISQFKQYGMDLDQYLKISGTDMAKFQENCKNIAKADAVRFALLKAVAKTEKLAATQEDLENRFGGKDKFATLMKAADEQSKKNPNFNVSAYLDNVKDEILQGKVNDFLYANN